MQIYLNDMLYELSLALDYVEGELLGAKAFHSERVAYIAVRLGQKYGFADINLLHLAAAAVLHDNALTEYISLRLQNSPQSRPAPGAKDKAASSTASLRPHCSMGEKNLQVLPFYSEIQDSVLYHHENADGSGPFALTAEDTPVFAQLIHLADQLDNRFPLNQVDAAAHSRIHEWVTRHTGHFFAPKLAAIFHEIFTDPLGDELADTDIRHRLQALLPHIPQEYNVAEIQGIATMFAHIIDYKSHFTCTHSVDIARKAERLGRYLDLDSEICTKLYLAGALHDIGKLTIANKILEKPDRLTNEEYEIIKTHAMASWRILQPLIDLPDVVEWASLHHEKLNGSGYPFGKTAADLSLEDRLLCCVDIYQALIEPRPYKEVMPHAKAIAIMRTMVQNGEIDGQLTEAIDQCFRNY